MNIAYPYAIGADGRTASATTDAHIRDMLEQLLLTNPGERVNRPGFGSGLYQLVFAPNSPELVATLQVTLQAAVQLYLADVITVRSLNVTAADERLSVQVSYVRRQTNVVSAVQVELSPGTT